MSPDAGEVDGLTTAKREEVRQLKAEVRRLREDNAILKRRRLSSRGVLPPNAKLMGFIDAERELGLCGRVDLPGRH